jgi:hypothetical protein
MLTLNVFIFYFRLVIFFVCLLVKFSVLGLFFPFTNGSERAMRDGVKGEA